MTPLTLTITREKWSDFYLVTFPDGSSEEIECPDMLDWLRERHAKPMDEFVVGRAVDECWNFGEVVLTIENSRQPKRPHSRVEPRV